MDKRARTFLDDAVDFVALGSHSLVEDDFSNCFLAASSVSSFKWGIIHSVSFFIRYFVLFPMKLFFLFIGCCFISVLFIYGRFYRNYGIIQDSFILFNKLFVFVLNCKIKHVGIKRMINKPHVYVSNHTSFIDYILLSSYKFSHACITEGHTGLFGLILNNILIKNGSIGFKRSDKHDRSQILEKVKQHIHHKMAPMLIFPEGTCVNNESIVLFQKGAFELDALICPVGIKYSKDLVDPYWNRRLHGFTMHLVYLLTRWKIDCEIHWMNPMKRLDNETPIEYSHRVKNAIAKEMGLRNTIWNGYFKSSPVLKDREMLKNSFTTVYQKHLSNALYKDENDDIKNNRFYLFDENIDSVEKDDKLYFGTMSYRKYINYCCKDYLREKCRSKSSEIVAGKSQ